MGDLHFCTNIIMLTSVGYYCLQLLYITLFSDMNIMYIDYIIDMSTCSIDCDVVCSEIMK